MKASSAALRSVMYDFPDHLIADFVTVFFPSGTQRFTTLRAALTIGSDTFSSAHLEVPDLQQGLGSEVEVYEFEIGAASLTVAGLGFLAAAMTGLFNGVRVLVQRGRTRTTFTGYAAADLETVFDGVCTKAIPRVDSVVELTVQSALSLGNVPASKRRVSADCPFSLGDSSCGVTLASFRDARTVAAGSTASVVKLSSSSTRAVIGSVLAITSGTWSGQSRVVRSVSGVDCTLDVPLPGIEVGASCNITRACDKKIATCSSVFSNAGRCGCTPNAPSGRK